MPGETVRFGIGATVLGVVMGRERLTPFELAGSPVLTGLNIPPAIGDESHPFQAVINISVLLQSLDHDANPANGIVIRQGVADLLRGVRLDLRKHWSTFQKFGGMSRRSSGSRDYSERRQNETALRHVLATASRQQRFSVPHRIVRPPVALGRLYHTLKIDPKLAGVSRLRLADDVYTRQYRYDIDGNVLHVWQPAETPQSSSILEYDRRGHLTRT